MKNLQLDLEKRLDRVRQVFDIDKVLSVRPDLSSIARYYRVNKLAYSLFHNSQGFVHMGISRDLNYKSDDLLGQPNLVAKYIEQLKARRVLELAAGKGASSIYLARKFPNVQFVGIDLSGGQQTLNFSLVEGDYHDLDRYPKAYFDVVFVIEGLCHSTQKGQVAAEVWRVLKDGGVFIVFDGYLGRSEGSLNANERLAKKLTECGMLVANFERYEDVKEKILRAGFNTSHEEDVSNLIVPTLRRFESLARKTIFAYPQLGRLLVRLLPKEFSYNAISGYLMPLLIELGVAKYVALIVEKRVSKLLKEFDLVLRS